MSDVWIRWTRRGTRILRGIARPRYPGDEDVVPEEYARVVVRTGKAIVLTGHQVAVLADFGPGNAPGYGIAHTGVETAQNAIAVHHAATPEEDPS